MIIAVVALVQPWARALWRLLFQRAQVDIYETGSISVGFGQAGPLLALQGTLRAVHRDVFVREVHVRLTNLRDHSQHQFQWATFWPTTTFLGGAAGTYMEIPAGFMLTVAQPHRYNIQFMDFPTYREVETVTRGVNSAWTAALQEPAAMQLFPGKGRCRS
ncbi:MAG TPA: hypothetical protein VK457_23090 [Chloroflexota bacterium]|nr:hypothetical protein [Chloroflexota bacterium]